MFLIRLCQTFMCIDIVYVQSDVLPYIMTSSSFALKRNWSKNELHSFHNVNVYKFHILTSQIKNRFVWNPVYLEKSCYIIQSSYRPGHYSVVI